MDAERCSIRTAGQKQVQRINSGTAVDIDRIDLTDSDRQSLGGDRDREAVGELNCTDILLAVTRH